MPYVLLEACSTLPEPNTFRSRRSVIAVITQWCK